MRSLLLFRVLMASTTGQRLEQKKVFTQNWTSENKNQLSSYSIFNKIKANLPKTDAQNRVLLEMGC